MSYPILPLDQGEKDKRDKEYTYDTIKHLLTPVQSFVRTFLHNLRQVIPVN